LEHDPGSVGRNVESLKRLARPQSRELPPFPGGQIDQPEILPPKSALFHHQLISTGNESIAVADPINQQRRDRERFPVRRNRMQRCAASARSSGVEYELSVR